MRFREYDTVRIRTLLGEPKSYNTFGANRRNPRVGDEGIVVDIQPGDAGVDYTLECVAPGRRTELSGHCCRAARGNAS